MSDAKPIPISSMVYDLAEAFVSFRFRAELYWRDADSDPVNGHEDLGPLGLAAAQLQRDALAVAERLRPGHSVDQMKAFAATVEVFWNHFREAWRADARSEMIASQHADPDALFCNGNLLERSPLQDGHWAEVQAAADRLRQSLDSELGACFHIGVQLGSEVYPTFTGGQLTRDADAELYYLAGDWINSVRETMKALVRDCPFLSPLELDFTGSNKDRALSEISRFWKEIGARLREPGLVPGYLGLVLDRPGGGIFRNGQRQPFTSPTRWDVLARLVRNGAEPCPRRELELALDKQGLTTVDRALSDLRPVLKPLGIQIKCKRGVGWRLAELAADGS